MKFEFHQISSKIEISKKKQKKIYIYIYTIINLINVFSHDATQ